jgi:hypothetical protein
MASGAWVLLQLLVTVAQPTYDFADLIFQDGTVAFTAVLKNVSRSSVRVCTDSLESIRVKQLSVDGDEVAPSAPDHELDAPPAEPMHATLYPGATVDLRIGALLVEKRVEKRVDKKKGTLWVFKPPGRGEYKVRFEYRCSAIGKKAVTVSNVVSFRVH